MPRTDFYYYIMGNLSLIQFLRRISRNKSILFVVCLFMLIVQFGHLHMHNHKLAKEDALKVHVLGGQAHQNKHDLSGEIDLQFDSLSVKVKIMPDLLPLVLFVSLILTVLVLLNIQHELTINFIRSIVFPLRPPSRASPSFM